MVAFVKEGSDPETYYGLHFRDSGVNSDQHRSDDLIPGEVTDNSCISVYLLI